MSNFNCFLRPFSYEIVGLWRSGRNKNFEIRTYSACSAQEFKYIAGYQKQGISHEHCQIECLKHNWCRGIRISGPSSAHFNKCRLLSNYKTHLPGWTFWNGRNWAEPENWKETEKVTCKSAMSDRTYHCYEKISSGT